MLQILSTKFNDDVWTTEIIKTGQHSLNPLTEVYCHLFIDHSARNYNIRQ